MLKAIMKRFSTEAKEVVDKMVEPKTEQPEMAVPQNSAELSALVAQMASQSEAFAAVQEQLAQLTSQYEIAQSALAAIEAEKASLVATAAVAKLEARKQRIEATIGTAKAASVMAATESLDDVSFEAVVSAFAASLEVEEKKFAEVGVSAEAPVEANVVQESREMQIIKAKQAASLQSI